ncbi:RNA-binding protein pno1 [Sesamum angolense]|uniref:RNA-binding protein pno1 n=1 Tax=Sesamum angolense TaxID=2727404 RepID=A0AAE1W3Q7_9LAMI|nr:RNA-binding protein pno1 [Sesamum angolense]
MCTGSCGYGGEATMVAFGKEIDKRNRKGQRWKKRTITMRTLPDPMEGKGDEKQEQELVEQEVQIHDEIHLYPADKTERIALREDGRNCRAPTPASCPQIHRHTTHPCSDSTINRLTGRGPISVSLNFKDLNPSSFFLYTIKGFQVHSSPRRVIEKTDAMQNSAAGMEVDATAAPSRQEPILFAQKLNFRPLKAHKISNGQIQFHKVPVPPHRYTPLKKSWLEIYTPIYE